MAPSPEQARISGKKGGRPKGKYGKTRQYAIKLKERIAELVHARADKMIQAQIDAAIGVTTEKYDRKKGELYYVDEAPSSTAFKGLVEHIIGRPTENVELTGKDGAPLKPTVFFIPKPYDDPENNG